MTTTTGRPEIGGTISTAIGAARLARVDQHATATGTTRAEAIRQLLDTALAHTNPTAREHTMAIDTRTAHRITIEVSHSQQPNHAGDWKPITVPDTMGVPTGDYTDWNDYARAHANEAYMEVKTWGKYSKIRAVITGNGGTVLGRSDAEML